MRSTPLIRLALASTLAAALAACGGGGTDGSGQTGAAPVAGSNWTTDVPASQKLQYVNQLAASHPKATDSTDGESAASDESDSSASTTDRSTTDGSTTDGSATDSSTTNGSTTTNGDTADAGATDDSARPNASARASSDSGGPAGATPGSYGQVTLDEEWNGSLDESVWGTRMPHWTSQDLHNWEIEDGVLKLWSPHDENGRFEFNNRAINTEGKFTQRYGWFEIEAKLPPGKGLWPSFWLYGIYGTQRPEIDIMESFGGVDQWWGDPNPIDYGATVWMSDINGGNERIGEVRPGHNGLANFDLTERFHKYGAKWEPDGVTFFFDGQQIGDKIHTTRFDMELFIIIGMGTGQYGDYNSPSHETPTDSAFEVNYVRAWALPEGTTVNGQPVGN